MNSKSIAFAACTTALFLGCQRSEPTWQPASTLEKLGTEQTEGPTTEPKYPQVAEPSGIAPTPVVHFQPLDMMSNVGDTPLTVEVETFGATLPKSSLDQLVRDLKLVTWPERKPVAFKTSIVDDTGSDRGPNGYERRRVVRIVVEPESKLPGNWHALTLSSVPVGIALPKFGTHHTLDDGSVAARFSVDSDPAITQVRVCDKGGVHAVIVDFSERVSTAPMLDGHLRIGGATGCVAQVVADQKSTESMAYSCAALTDGTMLTIDTDRLTALSGRKVNPQVAAGKTLASAESRLAFRYGDMSQWADGCRRFTP